MCSYRKESGNVMASAFYKSMFDYYEELFTWLYDKKNSKKHPGREENRKGGINERGGGRRVVRNRKTKEKLDHVGCACSHFSNSPNEKSSTTPSAKSA